jgi:hypothetical protein
VNLGPLNHKGLLFTTVTTRAIGGAPTESDQFLRELPLTFADEVVSEETTVQREVDKEETQFLTRWFDGLKSQMKIKCEGVTYRVTRFKPLGRRQGYHIWTTAL